MRSKSLTHFGCFLSRRATFSYAGGTGSGGDFPNCTALNHAELPPPFLSRRGQSCSRRVRAGADQPPATAGMIETPGTVRGGGLQALLEADVVVVDVHVDEAAQLALVVQDAGGDARVVLLQVRR